MVNQEKVSNIVNMVVNFIAAREMAEVLTDKMIDSLIDEVLSLGISCSDEDLEACRRDLKYRYAVESTPGNIILNDYDQNEWYTERKDEIEQTFWLRYKSYLLDDKGFSPNIVSKLGNETLDQNLMNHLLDPDIKSETPILRRGLVIGDVQSGKTSTYIGLICKAADAGFKVFILLTGTIESLRKQTQERVEEGFIGIDMSDITIGGKRVGVGMDNKPLRATAFTSRNNDFTGNSDKIAVALDNFNAVVFVIKKQREVLRKLTNWLIKMNADPITKRIDLPMLMIDDEADNASINTSKDKENPTTINKLIRKLANIFTLSNYVGFTATPFANVFIDPATTEEMENQDLFPEDFIVSLPTPDNYIGPEKIFSPDGKYHNQLVYITDAGTTQEDGLSFYLTHKKDWTGDLPGSLTDAMYTFYIANAIRDLRGDGKSHRSMLVNMSRFIRVQEYILSEIERIHQDAYRNIKFNLSDNFEESMRNPVLKHIYEIWESQYSDTEFTWEEIANVLCDAIEPIMIQVVNSARNSDKLVYPQGEGIRVIAIGGLALSRGLTLEGLVVSYFCRNTCTYDVLMQMGRWFGYRRGYEDLFRIWIRRSSAEWYAEISEATEELKADMRLMNESHKRPKDFGIRVKNNSEELQITSANKMRNSVDELVTCSYFGSIIETPYLVYNPEKQIGNYQKTIRFIKSLEDNNYRIERVAANQGRPKPMILKVPKEYIIDFLESFVVSKYNTRFKTEQILRFLNGCDDRSIAEFDIAFSEGKKGSAFAPVTLGHTQIIPILRSNCQISEYDDRLDIGRRGKLGGPGDGLAGILDTDEMSAEDIISGAKERFKTEYQKKQGVPFKDDATYPGRTWFQYVKSRRPLLIIYFICAEGDESNAKSFTRMWKAMGDALSVGLALGFPENDTIAAFEMYSYRANKTYNYFERDEMIMEGEEE